MTPAQQTALENLVGRQLPAAEIDTLDPHIATRNDVAIAEILSADRVRIVETPIGIGTCLAVMAPHGGAFLDSLEQLATVDSNVKWSLKLIESATFDVGNPVTRAQLQEFAATQPAISDAIHALLAVAEQPDLLPVGVISDALNRADGLMTLEN